MSDFRQLSESVWASPQIDAQDLTEASERGFALIINNRPDGESDDQPDGQSIAEQAKALNLDYCAIPINHSGFSDEQVAQMADALNGANGPVLAYCRSGTRSTFLWSLAQARLGADPAAITTAAAQAGYDIAPIAPALAMYHSKLGS